MTDDTYRALLNEALDLFNDAPRFSLRRDRKRTSYALAARIEAYLDTSAPPHPAIAVARDRWGQAGILRIAEAERDCVRDAQGFWVRAWVRVDAASLGEIAPEAAARYRGAFAALPKRTAAILRAHQRGADSITAIAAQFGITTADAERHIAEGLAAIARALDPQ